MLVETRGQSKQKERFPPSDSPDAPLDGPAKHSSCLLDIKMLEVLMSSRNYTDMRCTLPRYVQFTGSGDVVVGHLKPSKKLSTW